MKLGKLNVIRTSQKLLFSKGGDGGGLSAPYFNMFYPTNEDLILIGKYFKYIRTEVYKMSINNFAELIGASRPVILNFEKGRTWSFIGLYIVFEHIGSMEELKKWQNNYLQ